MLYFNTFERTIITHFVSDMWDPYIDIHKICFKHSVAIIDKYHFIRQVIWAFEAVRKEEQKNFQPTAENTLNGIEYFLIKNINT